MKNNYLLIVSALICLTNTLQAQITFQKMYGGTANDYGSSVQQTADGGYILAGYTLSFGAGNGDFYLVKTNSSGNLIWSKTFGGAQTDYAYSVIETTDGGIVIDGYSKSFGAGIDQVYLVKTDSVGNYLWSKLFNNIISSYSSVIQTLDGGFLLTAEDALIKTNSIGNIQWSKDYNFNGLLRMALQTPDSGYISVGYSSSSGAGSQDILLIRIDKSGNVLWAKNYGGIYQDYGVFVASTPGGQYLVGADTYTFGTGIRDFFVLSIDSAGNLLWSKTYGTSGNDFCSTLQPLTDGTFVLSGYTPNACLAKIDSIGNLLWAQSYTPNGGSSADYCDKTTDGGFVIGGTSNSNFLLLKADSNGISACNTNALALITTTPTPVTTNLSLIVTAAGTTVINPVTASGIGGSETPICISTSVSDLYNGKKHMSLFPNPVSNSLSVSFYLPRSENISLKIFDAQGRRITTFADKLFDAGENEVVWDANDVEAGIYFVHIQSIAFIETKKFIVVK